jgi:hypothetical protein
MALRLREPSRRTFRSSEKDFWPVKSWEGTGIDMDQQVTQLPALPEIGHPESWYAKRVHEAEAAGDNHAREAWKVGQYITLGMNQSATWEEKLKCFRHALKRHCHPPEFAEEDVWLFYKSLSDLVRQYAGAEALRIASAEDDMYAARLAMGQDREQIEDDAEEFFGKLMANPGGGGECPEIFNESDFSQLKLIRDQWI